MKKLLLLTFLGFFLFAGIGLAQENNNQVNDLPNPGMLPDHPLYFLKNLWEDIVTFFTFGEMAKAERYMFLAEMRMAEAFGLIDKGKDVFVERALERHQERLNRALAKAEQAKEKGMDTDDLLTRVSEATLKHQDVLLRVIESAPEQAVPALERAMEQSMKGHERAFEAISSQKREEVREDIEAKKERIRQRIEQARDRGIMIPVDTPEVVDELNGKDEEDLPEEVETPIDETEEQEEPAEELLPIMEEFPGKVVYTTDMSLDPASFEEDCRERNGVFNACGDICPPEAEMCATVCAFTCEF